MVNLTETAISKVQEFMTEHGADSDAQQEQSEISQKVAIGHGFSI